MSLASKKCVPCEGSVPKLGEAAIGQMLSEVEGWSTRDDKLHKTAQFKDFVTAMAFVNRLAEVAEAEGHHPDFCVHYNEVAITIWTHAIGGLSENDFILAAKLDELLSE